MIGLYNTNIQLDDAIEARELIKINVLESSGEDVKALGNEVLVKTDDVSPVTIAADEIEDGQVIVSE